MLNKRITIVFGTRPEAIKLAPVIGALSLVPSVKLRVVATGQHRQMLDSVLNVFGIQPDVDLAVMTENQTLASLTARLIEKLDQEFLHHPAELVLVQGDTTTALAAALAAFYRKIPIGHVEAGLRTGDLNNPWPEEANRVLISRLAKLHFTPTDTTRDHLLWDGVPEPTIHLVGNTVVDALLMALERIDASPINLPQLPACCFDESKPLVLITGHRRESFGAAFEQICLAIRDLAQQFTTTQFVYPVHLNPQVREPVYRVLGHEELANVHLIEPLNYLEFLSLFRRAALVLSDSGGVQEEAPTLQVPVLLLRDTTERPEAVASGHVTLVGTNRERIVAEASAYLTGRKERPTAASPYGDGQSAQLIAKICAEFLQR